MNLLIFVFRMFANKGKYLHRSYKLYIASCLHLHFKCQFLCFSIFFNENVQPYTYMLNNPSRHQNTQTIQIQMICFYYPHQASYSYIANIFFFFANRQIQLFKYSQHGCLSLLSSLISQYNMLNVSSNTHMDYLYNHICVCKANPTYPQTHTHTCLLKYFVYLQICSFQMYVYKMWVRIYSPYTSCDGP